MGNDIRDSTGTNEEHSSLKLSVYSTFISKLDKTAKKNKDVQDVMISFDVMPS